MTPAEGKRRAEFAKKMRSWGQGATGIVDDYLKSADLLETRRAALDILNREDMEAQCDVGFWHPCPALLLGRRVR